MNKKEFELLKKLRGNDKDSYRQLFFLYYQPLLIFAKKFVDEESAKDLIQDCFLNLWNDRKRLNITTSIPAYLFTIIKNRCYKLLNEKQQQTALKNRIGLQLKQEELFYFTNSEKSILEFDVKDRIKKVVGKLPEKCSEVFKASRFEGLSNKEIAGKYGISVKAVEKQISKALKLFREEFKDILTIFLILLLHKF